MDVDLPSTDLSTLSGVGELIAPANKCENDLFSSVPPSWSAKNPETIDDIEPSNGLKPIPCSPAPTTIVACGLEGVGLRSIPLPPPPPPDSAPPCSPSIGSPLIYWIPTKTLNIPHTPLPHTPFTISATYSHTSPLTKFSKLWPQSSDPFPAPSQTQDPTTETTLLLAILSRNHAGPPLNVPPSCHNHLRVQNIPNPTLPWLHLQYYRHSSC